MIKTKTNTSYIVLLNSHDVHYSCSYSKWNNGVGIEMCFCKKV